ncbi:MAG: hypothetical protein N2255_02090 [Kiritimatiellae bacterium]|nr:hypothetical protein [Kiritimatiellia bacterium]
MTISFTVTGPRDATVAIKDFDGRIVRHLGSGLLGPNAPSPFRSPTFHQTVVWDGKDDLGCYLEHPERGTVRISLGLCARFEKMLLGSVYKRLDDISERLSLPLI